LACACPSKPAPEARKPDGACAECADTGSACCSPVKTDSAGQTDNLDLAAELAMPIPKLWDFGSQSCQPCRQMLDILDPLGDEYKEQVAVLIIDVYAHPDWAKKYRIVTIPTQVFIDATGKEVFRHIGVYPRDSIIARFAALNFTRPAASR
jgi:thioredoxin 1